MRYEWKPPTCNVIRASDEDSDVPGFFIQTLSGDWRPLLGGSADVEAVEEILRLARKYAICADKKGRSGESI